MQDKNKILGFTALVYALLLCFVLVSNFAGRSSEHWAFFYAFTQQSNIIALIWLILFGVSRFKSFPDKFQKIIDHKLTLTAVTVYISITFFIVALVLDPIYTGSYQPLSSSFEFFLHNATPVLLWFYFFLVPGEGKLKYRYALYILIYPLLYVFLNLYLGFNVTYESGDPAFAYGFINPNSYGGNYVVYVLVLLSLIAIFASFGVGLIHFKSKLSMDRFSTNLEQ